ncbi:MAG: hypothetical protein Q8R88_01165 [Desulfoprunum sp.]|nr:hypothetical protein [Desulfoprunum sp.]
MKHIEEIPLKIREIYQIVSELESMFGRHFTPDGHMVGSIGEVLAAYHYDLDLYKESTEKHDAKSNTGIEVQIKATQSNKVAIRSEPEHLIVLEINKDGSNSEIYNGPGTLAWENVGKKQSNGQCYIGVSKLRKLMEEIPESKRIIRKFA